MSGQHHGRRPIRTGWRRRFLGQLDGAGLPHHSLARAASRRRSRRLSIRPTSPTPPATCCRPLLPIRGGRRGPGRRCWRGARTSALPPLSAPSSRSACLDLFSILGIFLFFLRPSLERIPEWHRASYHGGAIGCTIRAGRARGVSHRSVLLQWSGKRFTRAHRPHPAEALSAKPLDEVLRCLRENAGDHRASARLFLTVIIATRRHLVSVSPRSTGLCSWPCTGRWPYDATFLYQRCHKRSEWRSRRRGGRGRLSQALSVGTDVVFTVFDIDSSVAIALIPASGRWRLPVVLTGTAPLRGARVCAGRDSSTPRG